MSWHLARALRSSASSTSRIPKSSAWVLTRQAHQRRALEYPIENGLGDFLSPAALKMIAVEWQEGLLDRLNEEVRGTELEIQSVMQTLISTATQKSNSLAFMYASQALNNSFFLDNLKPPAGEPSHEAEISPGLRQQIVTDFGALGHLKSTMSAAALGMSSSGWVWCVQDAYGLLGIVPTFGHGTILVRNRMHHSPFHQPLVGEDPDPRKYSQQPNPLPSTSSPTSGASMHRSGDTPGNKPSGRKISTETPAYTNALPVGVVLNPNKIGSILNPLFCISVHEHAWVSEYGVWGKEEYLKRFWTVLDWRKVSATRDYWNQANNIRS